MTPRDATTTAMTTTMTARASSSATDDATEATEATTTTTSAAPSFIETLARRRREHDALACEFALGERAPVTVGAPERRRRGKRAVPNARASRDSWRLGAAREDAEDDDGWRSSRAFSRADPPGCTKHVPSDYLTALVARTRAESRARERDPTRGVARLDVPRASSKHDAFR